MALAQNGVGRILLACGPNSLQCSGIAWRNGWAAFWLFEALEPERFSRKPALVQPNQPMSQTLLHGGAGWDAAKHSEDCRKECHGHSTEFSRTPLAKEVEYHDRSCQTDSTIFFVRIWLAVCRQAGSRWTGKVLLFTKFLARVPLPVCRKLQQMAGWWPWNLPGPSSKTKAPTGIYITSCACWSYASTQRWWLCTVWFQHSRKDWSWSYWARPCFNSPKAGPYPPGILLTYAMRLLRLCISCSGSLSSMATWSHQMFAWAWAMKSNGPVCWSCVTLKLLRSCPLTVSAPEKWGRFIIGRQKCWHPPRSMTASMIFGALAFSCAICPAAQAARGHCQLDFVGRIVMPDHRLM